MNKDENKEKDGELEEEGKTEKGVDMNALVEKLSEKLASAILAKEGGSDSEQKELKEKLFADTKNGSGVEYPADLQNLTKDQKIVLFFKSMVSRASDPYNSEHDRVFKALVEGTDALGGYMVPEELRAEVFRILPDFGVMRRLARVIPMSSDTLKLNSLAARPYAYWVSEYGSKTTTSAEFGQVTLTPNDLVCLLPVTHQLIADANVNIVQFILELFAEAIAIAEDEAFFTGSGTGQPKGISTETITTVDAGNNGNMDDLIDLMHSVPARVRTSPRAAFVAGRSTISNLMKLKDTSGNYIWRDGGRLQDGATRRLPATLLGYPVEEQNDIDPKTIYFGDWSYYVIGDRQQVVVETTREGGDAWRRNATEIKAVERVDGKTVLPAAFAKITNF